MSTFTQFMKQAQQAPMRTRYEFADGSLSHYEWKKPPCVIIIAGVMPFLKRAALEEVLDALGVEKNGIIRFRAEEAPLRAALVELAKPPTFLTYRTIGNITKTSVKPEAVIFDGIDRAEQRDLLIGYLESPTQNKYLIALADHRYESEQTKIRWIPTDKRVLYIDCNEVDADHMVRYCMIRGISKEDAEWLVVRCGGDIQEVCQNLDLLTVFPPEQWKDMLRIITSRLGADTIMFGKYAVLDTGNDGVLLSQLETRLRQLIVLALLRERLSVEELIKRAEIPGFIIKQVLRMTRDTQPQDWLTKLLAVQRAKEYHAQGISGVREFLAGYL